MEAQGQVAAEAALPHAIAGRAGGTPGEAELEDGQRYHKYYYCIHASPG